MNSIELLEHKEFSTVHHVGLTVEEIIDIYKYDSECIATLDGIKLSLDKLINPVIVVNSYYFDGSRNTHIYSSIKESVQFFSDEPLGRIASANISYNGINITKHELFKL